MELYGVIKGSRYCFSIYVVKEDADPFKIFGNCYPEITYYDYTKRDAIKNYRTRFGLVGKHIDFYDWRN